MLFEWGAILVYFYCSHRLAGLLHPNFRPPVLVTGILLLLAAGCVLSGREDATELASCDCDHAHGKLTTGGLLGFLVLLLPILLATHLSPDTYGAVLIQNRGAAESLAGVPAAQNRALRSLPPLVDAQGELPQQPGVTPQDGQLVDIPKGWVPPNAPEFSPSKDVPEDDYPSNAALAAKLRADSNLSMAEVQKLPKGALSPKTPLKALNERPGAETPLGKLADVLKMADSPLHEEGVGALSAGGTGDCRAVEVVDLLVAAQSARLRQELTGQRVELTGQVLGAETGNLRLLRLLILCCAADAQPLAVRIETHEKCRLPQMAWVKVVGKVGFTNRGKESIPFLAAESISAIPRPEEPYLY